MMTTKASLETARGPDAAALTPVSMGTAKSVLAALGDEFSERIVTCANERARTVEEISELEGIPLSTCYRRIRELVDSGLMLVERIVITPTGRRYALYRSSFKSFEISFDPSGPHVRAELNEDVADRVRERFLRGSISAQLSEVA